ncbi:MAG TPA: signal peptide peptidase SppA [Bryobacteraceae bacterium]|nr:signal peptide peptidase SppA [Bryobacteraceae bacterium]
MAKFFLGLAAGVLLVFLGFILLVALLVHSRAKAPEVASNSVLVLRLSDDVPEKAPVELPDFLGGVPAVTVSDVWQNLKKAASDARVRAVVVEPSGLTAGFAKLEEVRADLAGFAASGKPVFAYLRNPNSRDYYVSLAARRIYLAPEAPLMLQGLRAELLYFKGALDKLGVSVEVEHAGKYKDFGDMFTRTSMSPETREVTTSVVDGVYGRIVDRIAAARKKSADDVRALIDTGPFTASQALHAGLVDSLSFEDQMWGDLTKLTGQPSRLPFDKYVQATADDAASSPRIALVIGEGDIIQGSPRDNGTDETSLTAYGFNKLLRQVENDSTIKAVIVRIDSPGGEVGASDEIWRRMNLLSKKKPLVISMSDVAASGGYYMALTGDPIVAYPDTETGSIGVVFGKPVIRGLLGKLGVNLDGVQRGTNADIQSLDTPLTPQQQAKLRYGIDESYREFVSKVAAARHRTYAEIEPVAEGRVWLGSQAKENGLVDVLGGLDAAVDTVKKRAGIPASQSVSIVTYPPRRGLLEILLRRSADQDNILSERLNPVFGRVPFHAWLDGGLLRITPNWIILH